MTWSLLITSHGRFPYLERTLAGIDAVVGLERFDRKVIGFDGCDRWFPDDWTVTASVTRDGLAANLARGWAQLPDEGWVLHVEEDFVLSDAPVDDMAAALTDRPDVANMVLLRQPWNDAEKRAGSVLNVRPQEYAERDTWLEHSLGFWLNPCVYRASLAHELTAGVEADLTAQCRVRGMTFGYWGGMDDEPRCRHIGHEGGMGSPGWKP